MTSIMSHLKNNHLYFFAKESESINIIVFLEMEKN
jgi:hypothetical protein